MSLQKQKAFDTTPIVGLFPENMRLCRRLKNAAAVQLGRLAKGVKKTLTEAQRQAMRDRLAKVRPLRWKSESEKRKSEGLT